MSHVYASLLALTENEAVRKARRYEGFQAGGGDVIEREEIVLKQANCQAIDEDLQIVFKAEGASAEATLNVLQLPADWKPFASLHATVALTGGPVCMLQITIVGARNLLAKIVALEPGKQMECSIDLIDLPLIAGTQASYQPTSVRFRIFSKEPLQGLAALEAQADAHFPERKIIIEKLYLQTAQTGQTRPCVDRFGQRINGCWPTKVSSEAQMIAFAAEEQQALRELQPPADRDRYGGWLKGPRFEPSGFFRVDRDATGRWWLVTPEGHPFWSTGTTGVRTFDNTPIEGRETLFAELPDKDGPFAQCYLETGFSFYRWNVLRKYGSLERWREHALERFRRVGFNTVANWSEALMMEQSQIPHTRFLHARPSQDGYAVVDVPMVAKQFPDVFDPAWQRWVDRYFDRMISPNKDNPWVIGYFVDNETGWQRPRLLRAPSNAVLREHWLAFVRERFLTVQAFNEVFKSNFLAWEEIKQATLEQLSEDEQAVSCMHAFEDIYAERYFGTVATTIRKYAPQHLYLGCRFVRRMPDAGIVRTAGRYCDVVTVNCYDLYPRRNEFQAWYDLAQRPLLIGEHHLPLTSERQLPPLYPAFSVEERRRCLPEFDRHFASYPFSVGSHWYQHADQPLTGRHIDGENQTVGFVDITDRPHPELFEAFREIARYIYDWHAASE